MTNAKPRTRRPFDPWTSTREEADQAQIRAYRKNDMFAPDPLWQWMGAQKVRESELAFRAGDQLQVMCCVYLCAVHHLSMPSWLESEFANRFDKVETAELGSWDEAFGRPYAPGTQLAKLRRRKKHVADVYNAVMALVEADPRRPLDDILFEEAGQPYGYEATVAKELYREALENRYRPSAVELKRHLKKVAKSPKLATILLRP